MGTPAFAVESLKTLVEAGKNIVAVVTTPDKPAGRGQKPRMSEVKQFALERGLPLLQPEKLKAPDFLDSLAALRADLQVVVAFRMLPRAVWEMPPLGTINLHGSLLPSYRGAAPINWAVIRGETRTGVSTFRLKHEIDTGKLIFQESLPIGPDDNAGTVHDALMRLGAPLLLRTVEAIERGDFPLVEQDRLPAPPEHALSAPKIFKEHCLLDFARPAAELHNLVRGLSPYPAAWTRWREKGSGQEFAMKVFLSRPSAERLDEPWATDGKTFLRMATPDGCLELLEVQWPTKKRLAISEFLKGFQPERYELG